MCGIVGFTNFRDPELLNRMIQSMVHRGPDDEGRFESGEVSLGFRRLSIVDLATGNQPLFNEDGSVVVVFNGEIYNFREIKDDLAKKGHRFVSATDGEIIAHAYEEFGIECVQKFRGMFAFALWDQNQKKLFLVRDRLGIKPLHYAWVENKLLFSSEVKSLLQYPNINLELNPQAVDLFLSFRYVPDREFLFKHIHVLDPGHFLVLQNGQFSIHRYWEMKMAAIPQAAISSADSIGIFRNKLEESVQCRLMSDVPLGVYLSGGLDSRVIAALVKRFHSNLITFSHGLNDEKDEMKYARKVAQHLGAEHREVKIEDQHLYDLPELLYHMDSPIANSDIIGFHLLAKLAKNHVKVVLAGEGADELFGSYVHQSVLFYASKIKQKVPKVLWQRVLPTIFDKAPLSLMNAFFEYPGYSLDQKAKERVLNFLRSPSLAQDYFTLNSLLGRSDKDGLYTDKMKQSLRTDSQIKRGMEQILSDDSISDTLNRLIKLEFQYWLPAYHLIKEDKIAMSQGLEQRYPFLDHHLVEFMASLPGSYKMRRRVRKYILRKATEDLLPTEIIQRPKGPILVPIRQCFPKSFDAMVNTWLTKDRLQKRGLFNFEYLEKLKQEREKNPFLVDRQIFALLVLEIWCDIFLDRRGQV